MMVGDGDIEMDFLTSIGILESHIGRDTGSYLIVRYKVSIITVK